MRTTVTRGALMVRLLVLGALLLGLAVIATSGLAADTGVLKLHVARCMGGGAIDKAQVDVIIYRPGVGQVDGATGYTNSAGYVEFTFTSLAIGDEARTTVTPDGESPDAGHTYVWTTGPGDVGGGEFDLGSEEDSMCSDGWYDLSNRIFECLYE